MSEPTKELTEELFKKLLIDVHSAGGSPDILIINIPNYIGLLRYAGLDDRRIEMRLASVIDDDGRPLGVIKAKEYMLRYAK